MEVVEHSLEVSIVNSMIGFCEDIHKTTKCSEENCSFAIYINSLKDVLDSEKDYYFQVS